MLGRLKHLILERVAQAPEIGEVLGKLASGHPHVVAQGARGGATPALLALLAQRERRPILILTSSLDRAEALTDGLMFFLAASEGQPGDGGAEEADASEGAASEPASPTAARQKAALPAKVAARAALKAIDGGRLPLIFPSLDTLPFEEHEPVLHLAAARNRVLTRLAALKDATADERASKPAPLIVAPADAVMLRVLPAAALRKQVVRIGWGDEIVPEELAAQLVAMGYGREALVEAPGEFAIRGSIIDVFPPDAEYPWRFDLFGEQVDQIRQFDPGTQRSLQRQDEIERVEILATAALAPAREWLSAGQRLDSFFNLLPEDTLIVLDGPSRFEQRLLHFDETANRHWNDIHRKREGEEENYFVANHMTPGDWVLNSTTAQAALEDRPRLAMADLASEVDRAAKDRGELVELGALSLEAIPSQFQEYLGIFRERLRKGQWIVIVCDNNGQVLRLDELLREHELPSLALTGAGDVRQARGSLPWDASSEGRSVMLLTGELHEGFQYPAAGLFLATDREIFGRYKKRHIYRKAFRGRPVANPSEIQRGDYVVHVEHGIGLFERVRRQQIDGRLAEFLELTYAEGDKLLVPVEKLHLVQKYAGAEGKAPVLDKLGSKKWQTKRRKSMEAVRRMAGELLELYARREAAEGHVYGADTTFMQEFEASFLYQETPDQLKAIEDVKRDMSSPRPMDRLICGDVGYGKTEVAIRAAFKALTEGRQVAILAPTTLLVQQHFTTFKERLAEYPYQVDMLSRFRSPKEQKDALDRLESGELHLIIGTHRMLGRDVRFKDLGLLVVDEEQRFGVAQKEKIKALKSNVDILTLSATPIPRTLYMSLAGLRDLSIINTPPANRHPIKTRTIHWDRELIEESILRELNRGGQVYFIHNRIETIDDVAATVRDIVPNARIAIGHGQMSDEQLEEIMLDFIAGKSDILISTTIVENGIDIPNVNTIIINRADTFGLAQLYQLRGRVGRDVRQAYAYLILPPGQALSNSAVKRLEALEEFTDLGVGFSIAMRDMEIRGTGNLLGKEQHGAITEIGFELYCRMLEEAVQELKGMPPQEPLWPVEIKLAADQFIPEEYIPIESQRIRFYKDLASARLQRDLELLIEELVDRYGELPAPAANLTNAARLKIAAAGWRVDVIRHLRGGRNESDQIRIKAPIFVTELAAALAESAGSMRRTFARLRKLGDTIALDLRETDEELTDAQLLATLADLFEALPPLENEEQAATA